MTGELVGECPADLGASGACRDRASDQATWTRMPCSPQLPCLPRRPLIPPLRDQAASGAILIPGRKEG